MSKKGLEDTFVGVSVTHKPSWGCPSLEKVSTSRLLALVIEVTLLRLQLDKERRWPLFSLLGAVYLVAALSRTLLVAIDDDVGEDVDDARRVVVGKLRADSQLTWYSPSCPGIYCIRCYSRRLYGMSGCC